MAVKKKAAKKAKEMLCVGSKVKEHIRSKNMMCSSEVLAALNEAVYDVLDKAIARAEGNARKTVQARDL